MLFLSFQIRVVNAFRSSVDGCSQRALTSPFVFNSLLAPVRTVMLPSESGASSSNDRVSGDEAPRADSMETPM